MKPVLLCYDGSTDARRAIQAAGSLLGARAAVVVHVSKSRIDWGLGPVLGPLLEMPDVDAAIVERAQAMLDDGVQVAAAAGFEAAGELHTTGGAVWQTVLDVAERVEPSMIVAGSHGHRLRDRLSLGSVAQGLLAHAAAPLLISHPNDEVAAAVEGESRGEGGPVRALVAYDGSAVADAAVRAVAALLPGASARIVSVWDVPTHVDGALGPHVMELPMLNREMELRDAALQVAERGGALAADAGLEVEARAVPADRGIGRTLLECAREFDAGVVALGTHGHAAITRALLGSTASFVVQHADRLVLVVPPASE